MKRLFGLALVLSFGCGNRATTSTSATSIRSFPAFSSRLAAAVTPVRVATGLQARGTKLAATIPLHANEPVRVRGVEIAAVGAKPVPAAIVDGTVVFADAFEDTDLVEVLTPDAVEEVRILRSTRASTTAKFRIGGGVRIVVQGNTVDLVDANAHVVLHAQPIFAVDADGKQLPVTVRSEADVLTASVDVSGARFPVALDPTWVDTGSMTTRRWQHRATLLANGKVLITGGFEIDELTAFASAEIYDPATGVFTSAGNMPTARGVHTTTLLTDGKVLVAGGRAGSATSLAELYDPASGWTATGQMGTGRQGHTATRLANGTVLVAGGGNPGGFVLSSTEIYSGGTFTAGPAMKVARTGAVAVALADGRVLFLGGVAGSELSDAEIYAPSTGFALTTPMTQPRQQHAAALLPDGRVLVAGGRNGSGFLSHAEVYSPSTAAWTSYPMVGTRNRHQLTIVNGRALATGSYQETEAFDPTTNTWANAGRMMVFRESHTATTLAGGKVLLTGGVSFTPTGAEIVSTAELFLQLTPGGACSGGGECLSGFCVDGVCCATACTGDCQRCDATPGTCTAVSGPPIGTRSCAPYATCTTGTCGSSCTADAQCTTGNWCSSNTCVPEKANGSSCGGGNQCSSGQCIDGVCCDTACSGQCAACDVPNKVGTCSPSSGAPRGGRPVCTGVGVGTTCGETCDGIDVSKCAYPKPTVPCGATTCTAGIETHPSTCNGAGKCSDIPKDCGAYACDPVAATCRTTCATRDQCAVGYACTAGTCAPSASLGVACTGNNCADGLFCTDGVCCGSAACAAGSSCVAGKLGACAKLAGTTCGSDVECGSGSCVDGVCCDTKCTGQCEACDVAGSKGVCSPIAGAPHGPRPKCDDGAGAFCKAAACNGAADRTKCTELANVSKECAPASCSGSSLLAASLCDSSGACKAPAPSACVPYSCRADRCLAACAADADCAEGFSCDGGKCVQGAKCSDDRSASIPKTGEPQSCAPYRCGPDGKCSTSCGTTDDCAAGNACDATSKTCISGAPTEDDSGCTMGRGGSAAADLFALVAALGLLGRRRRTA